MKNFSRFLLAVSFSLFLCGTLFSSSILSEKDAREIIHETENNIRSTMNNNPDAMEFYFFDTLVYPLGYDPIVLSLSREVLEASTNTKSIEIVVDGLSDIVRSEFGWWTLSYKKRHVAELLRLAATKKISLFSQYEIATSLYYLGRNYHEEAIQLFLKILNTPYVDLDNFSKSYLILTVLEVNQLNLSEARKLSQEIIDKYQLIPFLIQKIENATNASTRDVDKKNLIRLQLISGKPAER